MKASAPVTPITRPETTVNIRIYRPFFKMKVCSRHVPFSAFTAISLCGVPGLAQTFPCRPVIGLFFSHLPCFHILSDDVLTLVSLHLPHGNCSDVIYHFSSCNVPQPIQLLLLAIIINSTFVLKDLLQRLPHENYWINCKFRERGRERGEREGGGRDGETDRQTGTEREREREREKKTK